jgi:hypothetical protein
MASGASWVCSRVETVRLPAQFCLQGVGEPLGDHDDRDVGVGGGDVGHHRGVNHEQRLRTVNVPVDIDDRVLVVYRSSHIPAQSGRTCVSSTSRENFHRSCKNSAPRDRIPVGRAKAT